MAITASGTANIDSPNVTPLTKVYNPNLNRPNNNYYNYNNNNNYARTREGVLQHEYERAMRQGNRAIQHGDFAAAYEDALGRPMPRFVEREIQDLMAKGISSSLILTVIEYTAGAPRPSWAYARAVILRSYANGINDDEDFLGNLRR